MSVWQRNDREMLRQVLRNQVVIMDGLLNLAAIPGATTRFMESPISNRKSETRKLLGDETGGYSPPPKAGG